MYKTTLRKVGGSVMLAVPPVLLEMLRLKAGTQVGITVEKDRLIVEPEPRPHYSLSELLAGSDYNQPQAQEEREWVDAPAIGREPL